MISSKIQSKDFQKNQILADKIKRFHYLKDKEEKEYDHEERAQKLEVLFNEIYFQGK